MVMLLPPLLLCLIEPDGWIRFDAAAAPLPVVCNWGADCE
jgi:hypothetical protein